MRKTVLTLAGVFLCATALAADFVGTWKLNQEKSPDPGPNVVSRTMKLEQIGPNAYRTTIDSEMKSGEKRHSQIDRVYDGQERHVPNDGLSPQGTEICEITPEGVRKITMKENGKVVAVIESTISADGKTMTQSMTNDKGKHASILDKQ
jgi:hypothetical protein